MASVESVLEGAAEDGSLRVEKWPEVLEYILKRLDEIILDFPKPTTPQTDPLTPPSNTNTPARPQAAASSQDSQTTDKENAPPATPRRPPVPAFAGTPTSAQSESQGFPSETTNFYSSIRHTLSTNFAHKPPYTIQRLAELILQPKRSYRFLSPYLRALDRVVSVSSPTTVFPLPQPVLPNAGGLLNGTTPAPSSTLGSDESLGGALLTPIPWLQNRGQSELISESTEMVEGPNGAGRIETVSVVNGALVTSQQQQQPQQQQQHPVQNPSQIASSHPDGETLPATGAVTQGEIIRQEQEAGIVLSNPHAIQSHRPMMSQSEGGGFVMNTVEGEDEAPHARGPELIGVEDTGLQRSSADVKSEDAGGRPGVGRSSKSPKPAEEVKAEGEAEANDQEMKDAEAQNNDSAEEKLADETEDKKEEKPDEDMETK